MNRVEAPLERWSAEGGLQCRKRDCHRGGMGLKMSSTGMIANVYSWISVGIS